MSDWWVIGIAALALVVSVISFICNWRHSESIIRRTKYPAVAWHRPTVSKRGANTAVSVTVCNHGPTEISAVWLGALISHDFKTRGWGYSNPIMSVPIGEELEITVTSNLEEDIKERFSGLYFDGSWHCEGKPHSYRIVFKFEYQPLMADTSLVKRRNYYLIRPVVREGNITCWEIVTTSRLRSLLPIF